MQYTVILKNVVQMKRLQYYNKVTWFIMHSISSVEFQFEMQKYRALWELYVMAMVSTRSSARRNWKHDESRDFVVL